MTEVRVVLSGADELEVMGVAGLEAELGGLRRVRARLDGHEARLLSALAKARQRAANRRGREPDSDTGSEDEAGSGSKPNPGPPAPSRKAQREAEARSQRLTANPDVADALEGGDINSEQADYLANTDLPDDIKARLLAGAKGQSADETRAAVREAEREQTREDPEERLARQRRRRRGSCGIDNEDMIWFTATLDPVTGAALKAEYDRRERAAFHHDMRTITDPRKRRSHQQRGADVIASMLTDGLIPAADQADPTAGARERAAGCVNLIIDIDQLAKPDGTAQTLDGTQIPASIARSMLCRAQINAWYQQADRRQLDLAYDVQYATPTQKLALAIRDGTCRWKHCNTEAQRCEAHHLHHREHGGTTNLDNLALLCPHHHDRLHAANKRLAMGDTPDHWQLQDAHGTVISEWTKPPRRQRKRAGKPPDQHAGAG
ncbi:MAG: hypothetical protein R2770_04450 [Acidimicrobiales bacterium]